QGHGTEPGGLLHARVVDRDGRHFFPCPPGGPLVALPQPLAVALDPLDQVPGDATRLGEETRRAEDENAGVPETSAAHAGLGLLGRGLLDEPGDRQAVARTAFLALQGSV